MSIPAAVCFATASSTARRTRSSSAAVSTGAPSSRAHISSFRSSGRGRLPTCVVRNRPCVAIGVWVLAWFATGGDPGGCITGVDEALGETWYFHAPSSVIRQLPSAVNGAISFSFRQSGRAVSLIDDDIVIDGPAGRLSYRFPTAPGTTWRDY